MNLLTEIERNPHMTQRHQAHELGIALGMINRYLKHCVTKGWVRASQISPRRITYFLTPEGLQEKSRMVAGYLSRSMSFFRDARRQCEGIFTICQNNQWKTVALVGQGDLADIATLVGRSMGLYIDVVPFISGGHLTVDFFKYDAVLISDMNNPQGAYDFARTYVLDSKILILPLTLITRSLREEASGS